MRATGSYDAVVVGGGPAGSTGAALLAARGFRVLLLDRAVFPRDKPCGEYTSPQTEAVLRRIGALEAVERAGARRVPAMRVISRNGRAFTMDYGASSPEGAHVLATPRRALDAALLEHARSRGVEVRERCRVMGLLLSDGRVAGVTAQDGRRTHEIKARLVIGADGVHSAVVRSLGLAEWVRWPRRTGLVAHYTGYRGLDSWGEMHISRHGYAGLAPLSGGLLNVGLVMPMPHFHRLPGRTAGDKFEAFARSFPGVDEVLRGAERVSRVLGVGPVAARVKRTSGPGYMLVGDAAGFFDPFTGEGVYKALRGAELAAEVASHALERNDLSARSLARYDRLRRREFAAKDLICKLIQLSIAVPSMMDYAAPRIAAREQVRRVLTAVIGDLSDARAALAPGYLWALLRP